MCSSLVRPFHLGSSDWNSLYNDVNEGSHFRPISRRSQGSAKDMFKFGLFLSSFIVDYLVWRSSSSWWWLCRLVRIPPCKRDRSCGQLHFNYSNQQTFRSLRTRLPGSNRKWLLGLAIGPFILDTLDSTLYKFGLHFTPQQSDCRTLALRRLMVDQKNHFQGKGLHSTHEIFA